MPIGEFEVEDYYVSQGRVAEGAGSGLLRGHVSTIDVYANVNDAGGRDAAQLLFCPTFDDGLLGVVENVGAPSAGMWVYALLPYGDFPRMYDILRSEAPVRFWCEYEEGTTDTRDLLFVGISSYSTEKPGEGPADSDAVRQLIRRVQGFEPRAKQAGQGTDLPG
jgi:hypothetical protein